MSTTRAPMPADGGMMASLAYHDPLTELANRATLEATANEAIDAARASGGACALAFADLNDLKRVNDGPEITAMLAETIAPDRRR